MSSPNNLDLIRQRALDGVARADLFFRLCLVAAALLEAAGLIGLLYFANFSDPTHRLILVQTVLVYGTLAIGILAVGVLVRQGTLRILSAMDTSGNAD